MTKMRVAIVDDEELARKLLREYLADYQDIEIVAECANGFEAVKAVAELKPDLLFLDIRLPDRSGIDLLPDIRKLYPDMPVLILTAHGSLDSAIQAVRLGAYDYLTKPFSMGQIDVVVQRMTDRLALEAENRQLARQLGARATTERETSPEVQAAVAGRLDTIETRLSRIEALLRDLADRLDRPRLPLR